VNGRPYRPHGRIAPLVEPETALVLWCRRNRRWLPLWAGLAAFLFFAGLVAIGALPVRAAPVIERPASP
jgi:hypothetical protein